MNTILNKELKMTKIKDFKLDGNWAEVTWVEEAIQTSEEGVETIIETQVHCESYSGHPEHIVMLTSKAAELGTNLDEYMELVEQLASTYAEPTQEELDEAERVHKLNESRSYLNSTDYKMTVDYFGTLTQEVQDELVAKRAEAREFIRHTSGAK